MRLELLKDSELEKPSSLFLSSLREPLIRWLRKLAPERKRKKMPPTSFFTYLKTRRDLIGVFLGTLIVAILCALVPLGGSFLDRLLIVPVAFFLVVFLVLWTVASDYREAKSSFPLEKERPHD